MQRLPLFILHFKYWLRNLTHLYFEISHSARSSSSICRPCLYLTKLILILVACLFGIDICRVCLGHGIWHTCTFGVPVHDSYRNVLIKNCKPKYCVTASETELQLSISNFHKYSYSKLNFYCMRTNVGLENFSIVCFNWFYFLTLKLLVVKLKLFTACTFRP